MPTMKKNPRTSNGKRSPVKVTKAKARRVAKPAAKVVEVNLSKPKVETPETNEARIAARERNVESRRRAEAEKGLKKNVAQVEIYRIKNRSTGEVRVLIDARGDADHADLPWLVTSEATGRTVGYGTRKELGANYAHVDLSAPKRATRKAKK